MPEPACDEQELLENLLERSYSLSIINEVLSGINESHHYEELYLKAVVPLLEMVGASAGQLVLSDERIPAALEFDESCWLAVPEAPDGPSWQILDGRYLARVTLSAQSKRVGELRFWGPAHLLAQLVALRHLLGPLCGQLGLAVNGIRTLLETMEQALKDGLTGLFNHAHFQNLLRMEVDRAARYRECFSIVMLDVDHFKRVNDTHGHPAGDEVLRQVAQALRPGLRTSDVACRYGGEEFALMLPATSSEGAMLLAERLRQQIARLEIVVPGESTCVAITASFGCATFLPGERDPLTLLRRADRALYRAKHQGRNQVCVAESAEP